MTTRRVDLIALQPLTYEGTAIAVGEAFAASPIDAAKLQYRRQAKFAPRSVARQVPPVQHQAAVIPELPPSLPPPVIPAEPELSGEPSSCVEPDPAIVAALPDPDLLTDSESFHDASIEEPVEEPRKSRRYKRRDLQAED